jgi:hypothetical protein
MKQTMMIRNKITSPNILNFDTFLFCKKKRKGQVKYLTAIIPATWEIEIG